MTYRPKILAFAGSARRGSYNHLLVSAAAEGARRAGADVALLDMKDYGKVILRMMWLPESAM